MKKFILSAIILLFAFSAHAADVKIGYVNMNRALNESDRAKEARAVLENMLSENEKILSGKLAEINRLEQELRKQASASVLSPEALREKRFKLNEMKKSYNRTKEDMESEAQFKQESYTRSIAADLKEVLIQIAKEENYSAIFESAEGSTLLYMSEKLDLTDKLIRKFNESSN